MMGPVTRKVALTAHVATSVGWLGAVAAFLALAVSTVVLLIHMRPISRVAGVAALRPLATGDLRAVRVQLTVDAGAALVVLLVATTLSVVKPRGLTARGRRVLREGHGAAAAP